jgi:hypothetical protein
MNGPSEQKQARRLANTLAVSAFIFTSVVAAVVFFTEEQLNAMDYVLIVGAPFALAVVAYFVGLRHDPNASD